MDINTRYEKDVAILDLSGKFTIGKGDVRLRGEFLELLDDGRTKFVINMDKVTVIDSSGLGELIRCQATGKGRGADIKLLNVNLRTYKLLTMSRLIGVFDMFDDEAKALASFQDVD
jgi:anti-sigma B factor antagonist